MTTPRYTKRIVEELNLNFTHNTQYDNKFARGRELERDEIDQQWTRLIQRTYPADDPKSYELLAQVRHQDDMGMNRIALLIHFFKG